MKSIGRVSNTKTILRTTAAGTLHWTGFTALLRHMRRRDLAILCYHRVLPEAERIASPFPGLAVTPEIFDAQMRWLARHYRCLTLREASEERRRRTANDVQTAVITFDDGYRDNATIAAPILKQHDLRATFFVISDLIGRDQTPWYDRLARAARLLQLAERSALLPDDDPGRARQWLCRQLAASHGHESSSVVESAKSLDPDFRREVVQVTVELAQRIAPESVVDDGNDRIMTSEQIQNLVRLGHEIGTHTRTHPILPRLAAAEIDDEIAGSCAELSTIIGQPVVSLAYPNGDFNEVVVSKARSAGVRQAVTTQPGRNEPHRDEMRLRRLYVAQERLVGPDNRPSDALFALELTGAGNALFLRRDRGQHHSPVHSSGDTA